jgi:tetratricopeptide (TPR) repeat protein
MQKLSAISKSTGLIFAMVMSSFFAFTQPTLNKNSAREIEADTLLGRQDYAGALEVYNAIIQKSKPASEEEYKLYYKRAVCYYGLQNFAEALKDVNTFLEKYPQEQAKLLRAYINQGLNDFEAQLIDLNDLLSVNPDNPELVQWRASVLMELGKYAEARKDIRKLLRYQSTPELKSYLGLSYYYQNNPDSALMIFDDVIKEDSNFIQVYLYAASLCMDEEAYEFSLTYINKGLQTDPSNLTLLFYKGIALAETDRREEGCRCLTKAFKSGMDEVADYLKEYCYSSE